MDLKGVPDELLKAELARREKKKSTYRPIPLANPDLSKLVTLTEIHIREIADGESEDSDSPHYIYEEVMQALYGPNVFEWINAEH